MEFRTLLARGSITLEQLETMELQRSLDDIVECLIESSQVERPNTFDRAVNYTREAQKPESAPLGRSPLMAFSSLCTTNRLLE